MRDCKALSEIQLPVLSIPLPFPTKWATCEIKNFPAVSARHSFSTLKWASAQFDYEFPGACVEPALIPKLLEGFGMKLHPHWVTARRT